MSSDDSHGHDKEPIILTSPRRFGKGLVIVVVTMAIGAGITIPLFDEMFENPPPVTQIRTEEPAERRGRTRRSSCRRRHHDNSDTCRTACRKSRL